MRNAEFVSVRMGLGQVPEIRSHGRGIFHTVFKNLTDNRTKIVRGRRGIIATTRGFDYVGAACEHGRRQYDDRSAYNIYNNIVSPVTP